VPADIETAVDVAAWFCDQALNNDEYLQPQKLHRLLFLAQGYYAVAYAGRKLMPAVFVADEMGPIEPNVYKMFAKGRPDVDLNLFLPEQAEAFLYTIWRRFGHLTVKALNKLTTQTEAYRAAVQRGRRAEISFEAMRLSFGRAQAVPATDQVVRPKVMRAADGRPVAVKSWTQALRSVKS